MTTASAAAADRGPPPGSGSIKNAEIIVKAKRKYGIKYFIQGRQFLAYHFKSQVTGEKAGSFVLM